MYYSSAGNIPLLLEVFEIIIFNRLRPFLEPDGLLSASRYGFSSRVVRVVYLLG